MGAIVVGYLVGQMIGQLIVAVLRLTFFLLTLLWRCLRWLVNDDETDSVASGGRRIWRGIHYRTRSIASDSA